MKNYILSLIGAFLTMLGFAANALPPDFAALTTGVDFSTLIAAVMAVAVLAVGFVLAKGGAAGIVTFIKKQSNG